MQCQNLIYMQMFDYDNYSYFQHFIASIFFFFKKLHLVYNNREKHLKTCVIIAISNH